MTLENFSAESEWPRESGTGAPPVEGWQPPEPEPSPDKPPWRAAAGIAVWVLSMMAIFIVPMIPVFIWLGIKQATDPNVPSDPAGWARWVEAVAISPPAVVMQILATGVAHLITIAICWIVVTRLGKRSFWQTLGWRWEGRTTGSKILYTVGAVALSWAIMQVLSQLLPSEETVFSRLLKTSQSVRISVAALAVLTAPLVEEVVYRGVLYSGLRNRLGIGQSVAIVTVMFAAVHFPQYWGDWAGLAGLTCLSLILTVVRATTRSLQPCFWIHTLFNLISAAGILFAYRSQP